MELPIQIFKSIPMQKCHNEITKLHILVTGGTGYIGSHTCIELLTQGYQVTVLDNLSNSYEESIRRVEKITHQSIQFVQGDIRDRNLLDDLFQNNQFAAVIHFAGLKAVSESVIKPLLYFANNVVGTLTLLQSMATFNVKTLVFSSSATVYGNPQSVPISETAMLAPTNPYGRSKLIIENILSDIYAADSSWKIARLRYFNPVGAHSSGLIGEAPNGIPNNLMPFISQVACGRREYLSVFGNDYPTCDGTGIRDYIHVMDLAIGHTAALQYLFQKTNGDILTVNLGTGRGVSVLEMLYAFEQASGKKIPYKIVDRRPGDVAECYANITLAKITLDWTARYSITQMCADTWFWQMMNPGGYSIA